MDIFLLNRFQLIKSLEAVSFIWFTIVFTIVVVFIGYVKYSQLRRKIFFQIDMFNGDIFFKDKAFFERYREKRSLEKEDFIGISRDRRFCEHLLHKQPDYYRDLMNIVENLSLYKFYTGMTVLLCAGILVSCVALLWPGSSAIYSHPR